MLKHTLVAYDPTQWCAVPANNGANGPAWQWGDELLVGFTQGKADFSTQFHQVDDAQPHVSKLARSLDGGETWQVFTPPHYQGAPGRGMQDARPLLEAVNFTSPGFMMRVEGYGYHGNAGQQWFYSLDKGAQWNGPFTFGALLDHPELAGRQFTGRTAYLVNGKHDCALFLSARPTGVQSISDQEKAFLARTTDGGRSFEFVSWLVPSSDGSRAVMPAPVRLSATSLVAALRRRNSTLPGAWIDCYHSRDDGRNWHFLSRVGDTGGYNGNPPAMIRLADGRLCCVYGNRDRGVMLARYSLDQGQTWQPEVILRQDFQSVNGAMDLGYPRLFQRPDGKLVAVYFWCSPERPETHIEATVFEARS